MESYKIWAIWLALFLALGKPPPSSTTTTFVPPPSSVCGLRSIKEALLGGFDAICPLTMIDSWGSLGVTEGNEDTLQKALNLVHRRTRDYVAILFYASWCPFSGTFRPTFSTLASFFPSIPHFAIEESSVRPSILSKYGVRGFPTLILLNSTMRVRYSGSRTLDSLAAFYGEITGMKKTPIDGKYLEKNCLLDDSKRMDELGNCPFPTWTRSPENLLGQETYLALATAFVFLRFMHAIFPALRQLSHFSARRYMNTRFRSFWEHLSSFLNRAIQLFNSLKEPCKKRRNLQEGALNANAWASKSLATVLFDDASSSRTVPVRDISGS